MDKGLQQLIDKLNIFVKKYYLSRVVKGGLLTIAIWGLLFLSFAILEHFARLSISGRTVLFFLSSLLTLVIFLWYIIIPLTKYFKLGQTINHKDAAGIIGEHFSEVQDKLRNVLDLKDQISDGDQTILLASINQKIEELNPIDFKHAVNLKDNVKYVKFAIIPLLIFAVIWVSGNLSMVTDSSARIVKYTEEFVPEMPFTMTIDNDNMSTNSNEPFILNMHLEGEDLPEDVEILLSDHWFPMQELQEHNFKYDFTNLQQNITFKLRAGGYESKTYAIEVFPFPEIKAFKLLLNYPKYTKLNTITIENQGDVSVPEGTYVTWQVETENGESFYFDFVDSLVHLQDENNAYQYKKRILKSENYSVFASNQKVKAGEKIEYNIQSEKDEFPRIEVNEEKSEQTKTQLYFKGNISDDYGFSKLLFKLNSKDTTVVQRIALKPDWKHQDFIHFFNLQDIKLNAGDEFTYYFEVYDNDGVNGAKRKRSETFKIEIPTKEDLKEDVAKTNETIKSELETKLKDSREIQKDLKKLQEDLIQKKDLTWEDKERIKELLEKQKSFEKSIDDLKEKNNKIIEDQKEFTKDEKLIEKQEKINDLLNELMDEETRKMFEEIEKLMEKLNKNEIQKKLEDIKMNNENLERELDRNLEMLKQFEVEQKFQDNIDELKELQKKQEELAEKTENTNKRDKEAQEAIKKEQEELNKAFEDFKKKQEELSKLNESLDRPFEIEDFKKEEKEISEEMKKASDKMEEGKKKDSGDSQKKSAEQMDDLAQQMENQQQQMQDEANAEDMETLRQILENLVDLSFEEETLIEHLSKIEKNDPGYLKIMKDQNDIRFKSNLIADSLFALSKRQIAVEATVIKEVTALHKGLDKSLEEMAERRVNKAYKNGQDAMTSANNLALLLSQVLDQMQKQQGQEGMKGSGSCSKPGGKGSSSGDEPSMQKMKSLQQQMKEQLKSLQQDLLNEGKQKGGNQPGQQPGEKPGSSGEKGQQGKGGKGGGTQGDNGEGGKSGQPGMGGSPSSNPNSESIVKTAAKQEAIRRQLEEISKSMEGGDKGNNSLKNAIEKMKEIEKDIINKNITTETLKRQEEIMQKMLEAEKAEREQEKDKKRKAKEAKQILKEQSEIWKKYIEEKKKQTEIFYQKPIKFAPFYQKETEKYLQKTQ